MMNENVTPLTDALPSNTLERKGVRARLLELARTESAPTAAEMENLTSKAAFVEFLLVWDDLVQEGAGPLTAQACLFAAGYLARRNEEIEALGTCDLSAVAAAPGPQAQPGAYWEDDPTFPQEDWRYDVANTDTLLGYHDWVRARQEEAR